MPPKRIDFALPTWGRRESACRGGGQGRVVGTRFSSVSLSLSTTMSRPSDPQASALLDHILAQTLSNVEFLASHNYISPVDASQISTRLITAQNRGDAEADTPLVQSMQALAVTPIPPAPGRRVVPPPPQPRLKQARALWAYNEDGRVCHRKTNYCH